MKECLISTAYRVKYYEVGVTTQLLEEWDGAMYNESYFCIERVFGKPLKDAAKGWS